MLKTGAVMALLLGVLCASSTVDGKGDVAARAQGAHASPGLCLRAHRRGVAVDQVTVLGQVDSDEMAAAVDEEVKDAAAAGQRAHRSPKELTNPSVVAVPKWVPIAHRAHPLARYYMYFAHHHQLTSDTGIMCAWAERPSGPWVLLDRGAGAGRGVVLSLAGARSFSSNASDARSWQPAPTEGQRGACDGITEGLELKATWHIASPHVVVDHARRRFIMRFHAGTIQYGRPNETKRRWTMVPSCSAGESEYVPHGGHGGGHQCTLEASSADGLDFNYQVHRQVLGPFYFWSVDGIPGSPGELALVKGGFLLAPNNASTSTEGTPSLRECFLPSFHLAHSDHIIGGHDLQQHVAARHVAAMPLEQIRQARLPPDLWNNVPGNATTVEDLEDQLGARVISHAPVGVDGSARPLVGVFFSLQMVSEEAILYSVIRLAPLRAEPPWEPHGACTGCFIVTRCSCASALQMLV